MKRKQIILLGVAALVLGICLAAEVAAYRPLTVGIAGSGKVQVQLLEGAAWVMAESKPPWRTVRQGDVLQVGDEVQTGPKARLECLLPDRSCVRFADNCRFILVRLDAEPAKPRDIRVQMAVGRAWANVAKAIGAKGSFEIATRNAVAGVRGTVYHLNVHEDKSVLVRVYDGTVVVIGGSKQTEAPPLVGPPQKVAGPKSIPGPQKVSMEEWTFIIKAMQQIYVRSDGTAEQPHDFTAQEDRDAWVEWNLMRDAALKGQ